MPLVVNTNVSSLIAQRNLTDNTNALSKSMERLSSGFRINRAADDAAGLQISETLRAQIRGLNKASDNAQDGVNMLQVVEGSLSVITGNIQRIRELTVQAANDTNSNNERNAIEQEITALMADIDRIADATQFNSVVLLSPTAPGTYMLQVGANDTQGIDTIDVASALGDARSTTLGISNTVNFLSNQDALDFLGTVDTALDAVMQRRATIGSLQNRLEGTITNIAVTIENFSASESRIRNLDVARESSNLVRNQILQQASASILSQANQVPALALNLI